MCISSDCSSKGHTPAGLRPCKRVHSWWLHLVRGPQHTCSPSPAWEALHTTTAFNLPQVQIPVPSRNFWNVNASIFKSQKSHSQMQSTLQQSTTHPGLIKKCVSHSVMANSRDPHGMYPTRLFRPGNFQVRIPEWVAIPSSRTASHLRDQIWVSYMAARFFTI